MRQALIYLFEDDASLQGLLHEVLRDELGAQVVVCSKLADLHDHSRQRVPDAIVADFWGSSQLALSEAERAQIQNLGTVAPLILVSARRWVADTTSDELGAAALVSKPIEIDDFVELVRQALADGSGLAADELADQQAEPLPPREALSVYFFSFP